MIKGSFYIILITIAVILFGCKKEYSCEGCNRMILPDTSTTNNIPQPYICPSCIGADDFIENRWSLSNASNFYCGIMDTAIAAPARNGFTIYGPSLCSIDSGLVMTINTEPAILNQYIFNSTTTRVGMYYYDNVAQTYPFITTSGFQFSVTLESYIHQTKMMIGTFRGIVIKPNGSQTSVQGKFKVEVF
ncbi:MAG TPA: hypothetical protein VF144_03635 [Chitinophagaceae bacterium]